MIILRNINKVYRTKHYNIVALSNINLSFSKGEVVVILGRSGSGKSTLLNILGGFDQTYSGRYLFKQYEIKEMVQTELNELRSRSIGFVFQNQVLFNHLSVVENVEVALDVLGIENEKAKRLNALKALTLVGLRRHALKKPYELSGGEKQRLTIARAIVKNPEIIICDEPTAALDSKTSQEILDLLAEVSKNKILIIATHNKSIVKNYGTRLIELRSGYLVRNELIKDDKSNVAVDEFDDIIDDHFYDEQYVTHNKITHKSINEQEKHSDVLTHLQLNLNEFKEKQEDFFYIDLKEYENILNKRNKDVKENDLRRMGRTGFNMVNTKHFANASFHYYKRIYIFFTLFLSVFMFLLIIGFNLTSEVFIHQDNSLNITEKRITDNQIIQLNELGTMEFMEEPPKYLADAKNDFIQKGNTELILNDPSFNFRFTSDTYQYLKDVIGPNESLYYDQMEYMVGTPVDEILFDNIKINYSFNEVTEPSYISSILGQEVKDDFSYMYQEANQTLLTPYLLSNSRLPKERDEVVVPINTLVDLGLLKLHSTNVDDLVEEFNRLDDASKSITIKQIKVVIDENGFISEEWDTHSFKIVGLLSSHGYINSFLDESSTFIFSNKAESFINIGIDNKSDLDIRLIPLYMEVNKEIYETNKIEEVMKTYQKDYINNENNRIKEKIRQLTQPLDEAFQTIKTYIELDPTNLHNPELLAKVVNQKLYPNLSIQNVIQLYLAYIFNDLDPLIKAEYSLSSLDEIKENSFKLLSDIESIEPLYNQFFDSLKKEQSLFIEYTIHDILFTYYYNRFNTTFNDIDARIDKEPKITFAEYTMNYEISKSYTVYQNFYRYLFLYNESNDAEYQSFGFYKLFNRNKYEFLIQILDKLPFETKQNITLSYFIYKNSTFDFKILFFSGVLLVIVTMSLIAYVLSLLFENIYHMFYLKRKKELGSLRILGASFKDIKQIIRLESKKAFHIAFLVVILISVVVSLLLKLLDKEQFTSIFVEMKTRTYFNLYLTNFFKVNVLTFAFVYLLMILIFNRFLFDRNMKKNLKDVQSFSAMHDWSEK